MRGAGLLVFGLFLGSLGACDDGGGDATDARPDAPPVDAGDAAVDPDAAADAAIDLDAGASADAAAGPHIELLRRGDDGRLHPMEPGDTLMIEEGWQGGYHVWASLLAVDLPTDPDTFVPFELALLRGDERVGWYALDDVFQPGDLGPALFAQTVLLEVDPEPLDGATVTFRGSVELGGQTYRAAREVQLACCNRLDRPDWELDGRGADMGLGGGPGLRISAIDTEPAVAAPDAWVELGVTAVGAARYAVTWSAATGELEDPSARRTRWRSDAVGRHRIDVRVEADGLVDRQSVLVEVR